VSIRLPGQKVISVSVPKTLLNDIDARAASIGLSRSAYLSLLARQDISKPTPPNLPTSPDQRPEPTQVAARPAVPLDLTAEVYDFLLSAIPALEDYARQRDNQPASGNTPEPPEEIGDSRLWRFFMHERDEILKLKWIESQHADHDIGLSTAIQIWLQKHRSLWAATHQPED
jgi:hypothetical protein